MPDSILQILWPPLSLVPAMGLLSMVQSDRALGQEWRRKSLHVLSGLAALTFPFVLTEPWMVLAGLSLALGWMLSVRRLPGLRRRFGPVLHDCDRVSRGELYFAVSIAVLLLVTAGSPLMYAIPVLILALADSAAAIVGRSIRSQPFSGAFAGKTVAGCTAFFVTATVITTAMLAGLTALPIGSAILVALPIAGATTIAEGASRRGLDNLTVPLVAWAVLEILLSIDAITGGIS